MEKEQFVKVQEDVAHHLSDGLHSLAVIMAEIIVEQEPHAGKMLPMKAEKEKLAHSLEKELILFKKRFERGCHCLLLALEEAAKTHPEIKLEEIAHDFVKLKNALQSINEKQLQEALSKNWSFQELIGMRDATIEAIYQAARHLYENQQYEESSAIFGMLTFLNAKHFIFWIGLGNSEFFCRHYELALHAYAIAVHANPDDPSPHLYSSKCFEELHQIDNALNALDIALFVIRGEAAFADMQGQIEHEKERLSHKRGVR